MASPAAIPNPAQPPRTLRLAFFGSGAFGLPTLQALSQAHTITGIISQPDRPAGRGSKLTPTPIAEWAATNLPSTPLFKPEDVNEPATLQQVRALEADAWVVIAFGQKLSPALLERRFAINLHASLLPRWRGAAPINWAILAGDPETGNSVITLADKMDAGLVLAQSRRPIDPTLTIGELHDLLSADGPALVLDVLSRHATSTLTPQTQDPSKVTLAKKLAKSDGVLDFSWPADLCRRRVHGLTPWPGVSVTFRAEPLKLLRVRANDRGGASQQPGSVLSATEGLIVCGQSSTLQLLEVQQPGKRAMPWLDFARGARVTEGEVLIGGPLADSLARLPR